nr:MAG TPA_asm: hypothetical protein [Caudoviricetes sp.]
MAAVLLTNQKFPVFDSYQGFLIAGQKKRFTFRNRYYAVYISSVYAYSFIM